MTPPFTIRLATAEDANAISGVIKGLSAHFLLHPHGEETDAVMESIGPSGIAGFIADTHFCHWVACAQGRVIAVAGLRDNAHLYHLFVAEDWQGRGVGRALWHHVSAAALTAGTPHLFTVNSTPHGRPFYEKFGFTATSTLTERNGMVYIPMALYPSN